MNIQNEQTKVFDKYGVFFAFSNKQYEEKAVKGVKYCDAGAGMITPVDNVKALYKELDAIHKAGRAADIEENGIKKIIHRELANYECQITMDYSDAVDALESYGITEEQIVGEWPEYFQMCVDNDYF